MLRDKRKRSTLRLEFDRLDRYGSDVTNVIRRVPLDPVRTGGRKRVFTPGECMSKNATTKGGFFMPETNETKKRFGAKQLAFSAVSVAIAFVLSYVKLYHMPWGGSVTLLSMFFASLPGWFFGPVTGLCSAFIYGILQMIQGAYYVHPVQICMDYLFAFTALGVTGFFYKKKHGLLIGYTIGAILRGVFHAIGGYIFYMDYMPEDFPKSLAAVYPIVYNYAYILPEMIITIVIVIIPAVNKALSYVKRMATE